MLYLFFSLFFMEAKQTLFKLYPLRKGKEVEVVVDHISKTYSFFLEGLFIRASFKDVKFSALKELIETEEPETLEWFSMFDRLNELKQH